MRDRIRPRDQQRVRLATELASSDPQRRVAAAVYLAGWRGVTPLELLRTTGVLAADAVVAELIAAGKLLRLAEGDSPTAAVGPVIHEQTAADVAQRVAKAVDKSHDEVPLVRGFDAALIAQYVRRRSEPGANVEAVIRWMLGNGQLVAAGRGVAIPGRGPKLSKSEHKLLDHMIETIRDARLQPPSIKELQQEATKNKAVVPQLIALAEADGELVGLTDEIYLHRETLAAIQDTLAPSLEGEGVTVSEIRELLGTSRKYAVPLCEYLDRLGFTNASAIAACGHESFRARGVPARRSWVLACADVADQPRWISLALVTVDYGTAARARHGTARVDGRRHPTD